MAEPEPKLPPPDSPPHDPYPPPPAPIPPGPDPDEPGPDVIDPWPEPLPQASQDYMRYEMSAAEGIAVGRMEKRHDLDKIRYAACMSLADAVIEHLPNNYQHMLGRRFDGGVDLSGGEWQKIALASAYLRKVQLLILDEPTSALDARSEHEVFQQFMDLTPGKMALLISHRFSTVRMADRIVVLENGRIAEQGSHEQLVSVGGLYSEMFEMQAASYR